MLRFAFCSRFVLVILFTLKESRPVRGDQSDNVVGKNRFTPSIARNENFAQYDQYAFSISESAKQELKAELEKDPLQQWTYSSRWSQLSDLRLNGNLMSKAIQAGNPTRLKNLLIKASKGQQINAAVIGGSNSAGGKLGVDEKSLNGLFFRVFADWWNKTIGKATKSFMKVYPVTIGGTGSYFFAFCYKTFIPKNQIIDIVLIETSTNYIKAGKSEAYEQLTRQVLQYPSEPAILSINLVSGLGLDPKTKKVINPTCANLENFGQTEVARHYDITSISLKEVLCRKKDDQWTAVVTNMAGSDGRHIGVKAHALVALLIIDYVRGVFNQGLNDLKSGNVNNPSWPLPDLLRLKRDTEALKQPLCWTETTPDIFQDLHRPSLRIQITENNGFSPAGSMRNERSYDKNTNSDLRTDAKGGWFTRQRYSSLKLRIDIPSAKPCYKKRSVIISTKTYGTGAKAVIWLDDKKNEGIYINTKSIYGQNRLDTVATRVEPGYHTITVRTVRTGKFLLCGVMVGPPDFQRRKVM